MAMRQKALSESAKLQEQAVRELLANIKRALPALERLLGEINDHWVYEDGIYRYYHHSFKVYGLQRATLRIAPALKRLRPKATDHGILAGEFCPFFASLLERGTGQRWAQAHNSAWPVHAGPIVEAFLHGRYFLEMAVKYGKELDAPRAAMPSGWAALVRLYDLRRNTACAPHAPQCG